jgi:hypothetical protein
MAGLTLRQQHPVELMMWVVLIYLFCKLFFFVPVTVFLFNYFEF